MAVTAASEQALGSGLWGCFLIPRTHLIKIWLWNLEGVCTTLLVTGLLNQRHIFIYLGASILVITLFVFIG